MAETISLTGRLADFTSQAIDPDTTTVTVKAPAYAPGPGADITTSSPSGVTLGADGQVTLGVVQGVGWLHIDGIDFSEQIRFVAAVGMTTLWEAVLNALPMPSGMKEYLGIKGDIQDMLDNAVAAAPSALWWPKGEVSGRNFDQALTPGTYWASSSVTYENAPSANAIVLEVIPTQGSFVQVAREVVGGKVWHRRRVGSSWYGWFEPVKQWRNVELIIGQDLDTYRTEAHQGVHGVRSTNPALPVVGNGWVEVFWDQSSGWATQVYYPASASRWEHYTRKWNGTTWSAWQMISGKPWLRTELIINQNLDDYRTDSHQGIHGIRGTNPALPITGNGWVEVLWDQSVGWVTQIYTPASSSRWGTYVRKWNGTTWSAWRDQSTDPELASDVQTLKTQVEDILVSGGGGENALALLGAPVTSWEQSGVLTSYAQGELYLQQLDQQLPYTELEVIGQTSTGRNITAFIIGERSKPILFIESGIHGDEVSEREAAFVWARSVARDRPAWLDDICIYLVPTVNGDNITIRRRNGDDVDINRTFGNNPTSEAQAVITAVDQVQPVFYLCCHEFTYVEGGDDVQFTPSDDDFVQESVRQAALNIHAEVAAVVAAEGVQVGEYRPWNVNMDTSRAYISGTKSIPVLLGEMRSMAGPQDWSGPQAHPNRYLFDLAERVRLYGVIFEATAQSVATMVRGV